MPPAFRTGSRGLVFQSLVGELKEVKVISLAAGM